MHSKLNTALLKLKEEPPPRCILCAFMVHITPNAEATE